MRKAIGVIALMVLPVSAVTIGVAGVAAAASGVTCSKLSGNATGTNATVTKCTDTANTGGSGTIPIAALTGGVGSNGTITWHGTGTSTITITALNTVTPNKCPADPPAGSTEFMVKATITGGTGKALKSIKKKWTMEAYICLNGNTGALSLVKGTKVEIGPKY